MEEESGEQNLQCPKSRRNIGDSAAPDLLCHPQIFLYIAVIIGKAFACELPAHDKILFLVLMPGIMLIAKETNKGLSKL